ncbi:MAG: RHS repeat-associated core domain-containing protein, partial [Bacteroidetes bacterium]|nr:RHS repeat-associated core domain-containing protein [Bacteroidota bacterium]
MGSIGKRSSLISIVNIGFPFFGGCTGVYRFSFNGQERDDEIKGKGNSIDYDARILDLRLGRFLSVDPLTSKFPMLTPYQFASNTPAWGVDIDGEEVRIYTESGNYVRGNVGHTFISVGSGKNIVVYTYGRYDDVHKNKGSANSTNITGEGVLIKLTGAAAQGFIKKHFEAGGKGFELTDIDKVEEKKVAGYLEKQWKSSTELPDNPKSKYYQDENAKVIDTYDLSNNNCTTKSCDAAKVGG